MNPLARLLVLLALLLLAATPHAAHAATGIGDLPGALGGDAITAAAVDDDDDGDDGTDKPGDAVTKREVGDEGFLLGPRGEVNFRKGPKGEVIRRVANGTPVKIVGKKGAWLEVEIGGERGFIKRKKFSTEKPVDPPGTKDDGKTDGGKKGDGKTPPPNGEGKGVGKDGLLNVPEMFQFAPENGSLGDSLCGPTSVNMCLAFYGIRETTLDVARKCKSVDSNGNFVGTYRDNLHAALQGYGLKGSEMHYDSSIDWLKKTTAAGYPVIVNVDTIWSAGHYMVCTGVKDGRVYVNDPGKSEIARSFSYSEFLSCWAPKSNLGIVVKR